MVRTLRYRTKKLMYPNSGSKTCRRTRPAATVFLAGARRGTGGRPGREKAPPGPGSAGGEKRETGWPARRTGCPRAWTSSGRTWPGSTTTGWVAATTSWPIRISPGRSPRSSPTPGQAPWPTGRSSAGRCGSSPPPGSASSWTSAPASPPRGTCTRWPSRPARVRGWSTPTWTRSRSRTARPFSRATTTPRSSMPTCTIRAMCSATPPSGG